MSDADAAAGKNAAEGISADRVAAEKDASDRKAAADSLRRQIESLKGGIKPRSLNEFVEEKMAEDTKKRKEEMDGKQD